MAGTSVNMANMRSGNGTGDSQQATSPVIVVNDPNADFSISDANGNVIVSFVEGHIKTKEFDSRNIAGGSLNYSVVKSINI